jgi:hypothetical protein
VKVVSANVCTGKVTVLGLPSESEMAALAAQAGDAMARGALETNRQTGDGRERGALRRPFFIALREYQAQNSFLSSTEVASSPLAPGTTRM